MPAFHPFSLQHLWVILIGGTITALFLIAGRCGGRGRSISTRLLAGINLSMYPLGLVGWHLMGGGSLETSIPLHLCDLAAITAGLALLTKNHTLATLTYFWGLAATIQGLLTPAVMYGFPSPVFILFFVHHFSVVAAALYLPVVCGWRPRSPWWKSPLAAFGWVNVYLAVAFPANWLLGTNFGFLMAKPANPSLLDCFGPWPWYVLVMEALAVAFFLLLTLPFLRRGNKLVSASDTAIPRP